MLPYKSRARHELRSNATLMFSCQILFFSVVELSSEITVDGMLFRSGCRAKCMEKIKGRAGGQKKINLMSVWMGVWNFCL